MKKEERVLPEVSDTTVTMGCDPEFFFKIDDKIIGSEKVLTKEGFTIKDNQGTRQIKSFVIDGVQAELNPQPNHCRANLANEISRCFKDLRKHLKETKSKASLSFEQSIKVSKNELDSLQEENKKLGCMPSLNVYKDTTATLKAVDPLKHKQRSAGGHIHLSGNTDSHTLYLQLNAEKAVNMLDIILGNTCVLIDRDPGNKIRRKLYGYAGEYRLPKHGLEYRTLSNFWLQDYRLMSLVFGLARWSTQLMLSSQNKLYYQTFMDAVDINDIQRAINNNNFVLAYKNFKKIEPLLLSTLGTKHNYDGRYPFNSETINEFHYFVKTIRKNGLQHWFKTDPLTHWCNLPEAHGDGMYAFLLDRVRKEMKKT